MPRVDESKGRSHHLDKLTVRRQKATDMFGPMYGMGDLSAVEKLRIVTALWDDIARSAEPIVVPDDILDEASRRSEQIADDPAVAIGDAELWRRVDG